MFGHEVAAWCPVAAFLLSSEMVCLSRRRWRVTNAGSAASTWRTQTAAAACAAVVTRLLYDLRGPSGTVQPPGGQPPRGDGHHRRCSASPPTSRCSTPNGSASHQSRWCPTLRRPGRRRLGLLEFPLVLLSHANQSHERGRISGDVPVIPNRGRMPPRRLIASCQVMPVTPVATARWAMPVSHGAAREDRIRQHVPQHRRGHQRCLVVLTRRVTELMGIPRQRFRIQEERTGSRIQRPPPTATNAHLDHAPTPQRSSRGRR